MRSLESSSEAMRFSTESASIFVPIFAVVKLPLKLFQIFLALETPCHLALMF